MLKLIENYIKSVGCIWKEGLIHIYTGDGKGKTTAAIGQGIRACGREIKHIWFNS